MATRATIASWVIISAAACACNKAAEVPVATGAEPQASAPEPRHEPPADVFATRRAKMVRVDLAGRDIDDAHVLKAMAAVPRHRFVPRELVDLAYHDRPLPIGHRQTISQPYIVALMTQLARARSGVRALDVGTGSGYQAAVLGQIVKRVHSIEIVCPLAERARATLAATGARNVTVKCGDGYRGWPEHAPFDVIILAAAPDHVPDALVDQLAPGGRLVLPVGGRGAQQLLLIEKDPAGKVTRKPQIPVRFVPMTGEARGR